MLCERERRCEKFMNNLDLEFYFDVDLNMVETVLFYPPRFLPVSFSALSAVVQLYWVAAKQRV